MTPFRSDGPNVLSSAASAALRRPDVLGSVIGKVAHRMVKHSFAPVDRGRSGEQNESWV